MDTTLPTPVTLAGLVAANISDDLLISAAELPRRFADLTGITPFLMIVSVGEGTNRVLRTPNAQHVGTIDMVAAPNETDAATPVQLTVGYSDLSVSTYSAGLRSTYAAEIYGNGNVVAATSPDQLIAGAPMMVERLARTRCPLLYTSIGTTIGSASTRLSYDDMIALQTAFNANTPAQRYGRPWVHLHTRQMTQIRESLRVEPGMVQNGQGLSLQSVDDSRIKLDFAGLGFDLIYGDEVTASGGGRVGGAFDSGGVGLGLGAVSRVRPPASGVYLAVDALGLIIQENADLRRQQQRGMDAFVHMGVALGDDAVFRQVGVLSIDAA